MKKVLALLMSLLMVFACASCSSEDSGDGEAEKKTSFAVGETADIDGSKYTVTDVEYSQGDEWDTPAEGKEYVIVSISIENGRDEDLSYNVFDWAMINGEGQEDTESITIIDTDTNLGSGDLKPEGTKSGTIVFEEPKDTESLTLVYYENFLIDEEPAFEVVIK